LREQQWEIEQVFENERVVTPEGKTLVLVKWVGYNEPTYEPLESVVWSASSTDVIDAEESGTKQSSGRTTCVKRTASVHPQECTAQQSDITSANSAKSTNSSAVNVSSQEKPMIKNVAKSQLTSKKAQSGGKNAVSDTNASDMKRIDYMSHSAMTDPIKMTSTSALLTGAATDTLKQLSTVAPALSKRSNASRSRKDNITVDEQMHRSAEMRDIVARHCPERAAQGEKVPAIDPTLDEAMTKALYYSGTDDSDCALQHRQRVVRKLRNAQAPAAMTPKVAAFRPTNNKLSDRSLNTAETANFPPSAQFDEASARVPSEHTVNIMLRHQNSADSAITKAMQEEQWDVNSALENIKDVGQQPPPGTNVCRQTLSTAMAERNYKAYGVNSFFRDTQYAEDIELERKLMGVAVRNLCRVNGDSECDENSLVKSRRQIAEAGFGEALVSVHSLCASARDRRQTGNQSSMLTSMAFHYPLQTDLRCYYDHHRFSSIPIFLPLAFFPDREMVSILSSVCFCSFSCAKSWIREKAPSYWRGDESDIMLSMFARKYFGITDTIKYAEPLLMHEDYGGPLNTRQWRACGTTHRSILRHPLSVAAPSTVVTEVYVRSRKDAGKVARIAKRTEDTHYDAIPERPERNSADAAEASKRKLKEGQGRPLKQFQTLDEHGNRVPLDEKRLEQRIKLGAEQRRATDAQQPARKAKTKQLTAASKSGTKQAKKRKSTAASATANSRAKKRAKAAAGSASMSAFMKNA